MRNSVPSDTTTAQTSSNGAGLGPALPGGATPTQYASRAETYRMTGNYSEAIELFSKAIEKQSTYGWAHAHRGAAYAALGNFQGALEDFERADASYKGDSVAWLHAQKGELCRLWARAIMSSVASPNDLWPTEKAIGYLIPKSESPVGTSMPFLLLEAAIWQFGQSLAIVKNSAWAHAHRGAVYTMRYWIGPQGNRFNANPGKKRADEDFANADADFQAACADSPSYGWAYAFWAVLYALRGQSTDMERALTLIGKALSNGLNRQQSIIRILMELSIYSGGNDSGVSAAWQALQMDGNDAFARYFVADGLSLGKGGHDALKARQRARRALADMRARILAMEGGLDCLDGDFDAANEKLEELQNHRDIEALALVSRDPAWKKLPVKEMRALATGKRNELLETELEMLNDGSRSHLEHRELGEAASPYAQLFDF